MISSTAQAVTDGKNSLSTGTLTTRDIQNRADYKAQSASLGGGYSSDGKGLGKDQQGGAQTGANQTPGSTLPSLNGFSATAPVAMSASGKAASTTRSGISGATLTLTDEAKQQTLTGQDASTTAASLNRDVATGKDASNALAPIFNEQEIQAGFAIVGALSREVGTFLENRAKESTRTEAVLKTERAKPEDERDQARIDAATQTLNTTRRGRWAAMAASSSPR